MTFIPLYLHGAAIASLTTQYRALSGIAGGKEQSSLHKVFD